MKKIKILIVEDEIVIAADIKQKLERYGFVVPAIVSTGKAAINKSQTLKPDLILMDIVLKGQMTGIEAAEKIKKLRDIPIVYLTAYADMKTLEKVKISMGNTGCCKLIFAIITGGH